MLGHCGGGVLGRREEVREALRLGLPGVALGARVGQHRLQIGVALLGRAQLLL